jgi:hypothetical protein
MTKTTIIAAALMAALAGGQTAHAAVTADEAAKLKTTLTPLGGEKAANKDGSIPAWNGGITKPLPGKKLGVIPTQIFSRRKAPLPDHRQERRPVRRPAVGRQQGPAGQVPGQLPPRRVPLPSHRCGAPGGV